MATSYLPRDKNGNIQWPFTSSLKGEDGKTDYTKVGRRVLGLFAALVVGAGVGALVFFFPPFGLALGIAGAVVSGAGAAVVAAFTPFLANVAQRIVTNVRGEPTGEARVEDIEEQSRAREQSLHYQQPRVAQRIVTNVRGEPTGEARVEDIEEQNRAQEQSLHYFQQPRSDRKLSLHDPEEFDLDIRRPSGRSSAFPIKPMAPEQSAFNVDLSSTAGIKRSESMNNIADQEARDAAAALLQKNMADAQEHYAQEDVPPPQQVVQGEPHNAPAPRGMALSQHMEIEAQADFAPVSSSHSDVDTDKMRRANYKEMSEEAEAGFDVPKTPTIFSKFKEAFGSKNKAPSNEYELKDLKKPKSPKA